MKNEEKIMAEGTGGNMDKLNGEINKVNVELKGQEGESGKTAGKNIVPHSNTQETKLGKQGDLIKIITKDGEEKNIKITPEMDRKLERLHDFEVEVGVDGKPVKKTSFDVLDMMGSMNKEGLTQEEVINKANEIKMWRDRLEEKYYAGSSYGNELRGIFEVVTPGIDMQKHSDQIITAATKSGQIDIKELTERMGVKMDNDKQAEIVKKLIEIMPPPGGVMAAPIVTVGEDRQINITPAPSDGGGISRTSETFGKPGGTSQGSGDGGNETPTEEEKKKLEWEKWASRFLFFLILYMGAQGWYAKMWEQFAERAR